MTLMLAKHSSRMGQALIFIIDIIAISYIISTFPVITDKPCNLLQISSIHFSLVSDCDLRCDKKWTLFV